MFDSFFLKQFFYYHKINIKYCLHKKKLTKKNVFYFDFVWKQRKIPNLRKEIANFLLK